MFLIGLRRNGSVCLLLFKLTLLPLLRCPFVDFFRSLASRVFPSSLSLPSEGRGAFERSRDGLVCFPRVFLSFCSTWSRGGGGVEESLVARSVHASSLLSPRFIRGLWIQELLSCGGLLLFFLSRLALPPHLCTFDKVMGWESLWNVFSMFSVVSPASSLHARRGGEAGETSECRSS